jgi:hypothetical protein
MRPPLERRRVGDDEPVGTTTTDVRPDVETVRARRLAIVVFCKKDTRGEDRHAFSATMIVVPRLPTPVGMEALPDLIEAAFHVLGTRITPTQRANLGALVALETSRGRAIFNGNVGNISAGQSYAGPVWRPPWFEVTDASSARELALNQAMREGRAPSAFRAYDSVQQGVLDFARLLLGQAYAPLLRAANGNDVDAFRRELAARYSPDYSNTAATRNLEKLRAELGGAPPGAGGAAGLVLLLGAAWWWGSKKKRVEQRRR